MKRLVPLLLCYFMLCTVALVAQDAGSGSGSGSGDSSGAVANAGSGGSGSGLGRSVWSSVATMC